MSHMGLYTFVGALLSSQTCEGSRAQLNCGSHVIKVINANYGRTDKHVCAKGRPASQITKTNCVLPRAVNVMAERCDGKSSCSVTATNNVFSDPCYGTYKYLQVTYICVPTTRSQQIKVLSANYGRTNKDTCAAGRPAYQVTKTNCILPKTLSVMAERCDGRTSCSLYASNTVFSDPCYGTFKYLTYVYICLPPKSVVACEGSKASLACGSHQVIRVDSANYGRHNRETCSSGRPWNHISNTHCSRPSTKVADRCNGKRQCNFLSGNSEFGDPCYGTHKYLEVSYICVPRTRLGLTCEHGKATLNCGSQQIKVLSANYGRTNKDTCAAGRPANQVTKTNCILPKTLSVMAERCDGRTSCSLYASNTVFSDPCYGTFKYLTYVYMCLPPPTRSVVACEGSTASLACGSHQVIRVDSANYGRHNRETCSSGRPCNHISNTHCSRPSTKVADRCNGKRQCNFLSGNSEFGDPCYGTHKYLEVSYHCLPPT